MDDMVIPGIRTMRSALQSIIVANGATDDSYLLIGKGTIAGSYAFTQSPKLYAPLNIHSRRQEGVYIQKTLADIAKRVPAEESGAVAASFLSKCLLEELIALRGNGDLPASVVLPQAIDCLSRFKGDYRRDRLIAFGRNLSSRLYTGPPEEFYPTIDVDLKKLDNKRLSSTLKRIYREMWSVEEAVKTTFSF